MIEKKIKIFGDEVQEQKVGNEAPQKITHKVPQPLSLALQIQSTLYRTRNLVRR